MDEAAAKLRMEVDSVPEELDEISRKIKQLEDVYKRQVLEVTLEVESSKSMARNHPVKQHWLFMPLLKRKKLAVSLLLLMPSMLSTVSMHLSWE